MKVPNKHYSNFLISVQMDRGFMPYTLSGKIKQAENFLEDLGKLARRNGKRLHATYSNCEGLEGYHAHFAVSWLPLHNGYLKVAKNGNKRIDRYAVIELLERNFFIVDNPTEAIKRITHDKKYVTDYVIHQPKDGQSTLYHGFYIHPDFVPVYSEVKMHSYCSKQQMHFSRRPPKASKTTTATTLILVAWLTSFLISYILLSIF